VVSLELGAVAWALVKAGEMTRVSSRQNVSIHNEDLFREWFIFPLERKRHQAPILRSSGSGQLRQRSGGENAPA